MGDSRYLTSRLNIATTGQYREPIGIHVGILVSSRNLQDCFLLTESSSDQKERNDSKKEPRVHGKGFIKQSHKITSITLSYCYQ